MVLVIEDSLTGARIKALRKERRLTQDQLAEHLDTKRASLIGWEKGKYRPSAEAMDKLSFFFGVSHAYLLGKSNDRGQIIQAELLIDTSDLPIPRGVLDEAAVNRLVDYVKHTRRRLREELSELDDLETNILRPALLRGLAEDSRENRLTAAPTAPEFDRQAAKDRPLNPTPSPLPTTQGEQQLEKRQDTGAEEETGG